MLSHYVFLLSLHSSMILNLELEMHTEAIKLIDTHQLLVLTDIKVTVTHLQNYV